MELLELFPAIKKKIKILANNKGISEYNSSKGPAGMCSGDWARRVSVPLGRVNPAGAHLVRVLVSSDLGLHVLLSHSPLPHTDKLAGNAI